MLAGGPNLVNATFLPTAVTTPEGAAGSYDQNWGGAFVWASVDAASYSQIGQITAAARMGVLTAGIAAFSGANPDGAHTLAVDLVMSRGSLQSVIASEAANADTLCYAGGELLSFQNATLTGGNAYNLTTLYRGLYGTAAAAHSAGAPFVRLDGAVLKYDLPAAWIGVPIYLKFQSYNVFGNALEDISECAAFTYTPVGSGVLGSISQALLLGTSLDFGLASAAVTSSDDWGVASDSLATPVDLGLASS
jgi:hypothetical protein